jgi:hypothetical protein
MTDSKEPGPFAGYHRATKAMQIIQDALTELGKDRNWLIPWLASDGAQGSIAPEILKFATGSTAGCSSGRACARLYLALQGYPVDLRETNTAFDLTRQQWWLRAMFESITGCWGGTIEGARAIERRHPDLSVRSSVNGSVSR